MDYVGLYLSGLSVPDIGKISNISMSTIRLKLKKEGVLRNRKESIILAGLQGKLSKTKNRTRGISKEWGNNISKAKLAMNLGVGISVKPNGYVEYTKGEFKGRLQHVVEMEKKIGRRIYSYECVHHKDENKKNNQISNLELMTRSDHARLHALANNHNRDRDKTGRYL